MAKINKDISIRGEQRLFLLLKLAIVGLVLAVIIIAAMFFVKQWDAKRYYFTVGSNLGNTKLGIDKEFKDASQPLVPVDVMKINYEEDKGGVKVSYLASSVFPQFSFCDIVNEKGDIYENSYCYLPLLSADGGFGFYTTKIDLNDVYIAVYENDLEYTKLQIDINKLDKDKKVEIPENTIAELIKDGKVNELNYIKESLEKNPLDSLAFAIESNTTQIKALNNRLKEKINDDDDDEELSREIQELKNKNKQLEKQNEIYLKNAAIKDEESLTNFKNNLREKHHE